jgi:EAL domain-containing protein (putative c-di-GMP-specific phosphodiesterase class I)
MSNDLEAQIVCEGVETETDLELMRNIEAYVAQGYYYSKPVPQHEFEAKLDAQ